MMSAVDLKLPPVQLANLVFVYLSLQLLLFCDLS